MGLIKALKPLKHSQEAEATGKKPQGWKGRGSDFEGLSKDFRTIDQSMGSGRDTTGIAFTVNSCPKCDRVLCQCPPFGADWIRAGRQPHEQRVKVLADQRLENGLTLLAPLPALG